MAASRNSIRAKGFRWLSQKIFEASGFHWELRRFGELKVGMWRKRIGTLRMLGAKKTAARKRFVVTPGFGDSPLSWLLVVGFLGSSLRRAGYDEIVMLDFPGFSGRLSAEKCFPSLDLFMESVGDVFDWLEPDTILGHSLGGWLSARYAADCGEEARPKNRRRHGYAGPRKLVLAASAGIYESVEVRDTIETIFRDLFGAPGFKALRPHLFAREPRWFEWIADDFANFMADEGIKQFVESMREEHLLDQRLKHIRAETWLLWGERDTLVPPGGIPAWLKGLDGVEKPPRAFVIRDVGHSPQIEKPAVMAAAIARILSGGEPRGRELLEIAG